MTAMFMFLISAPLALIALPTSTAMAGPEDKIEVNNLEAILKGNPLQPGGPTASIISSIRAGDIGLGVLVMSKNRLHQHPHQDHVLYLVSGRGTAWLENASGQVETRSIKPGDLFSLPRGKKHGFEKTGQEDLVFLVVATPSSEAGEETVYE